MRKIIGYLFVTLLAVTTLTACGDGTDNKGDAYEVYKKVRNDWTSTPKSGEYTTTDSETGEKYTIFYDYKDSKNIVTGEKDASGNIIYQVDVVDGKHYYTEDGVKSEIMANEVTGVLNGVNKTFLGTYDRLNPFISSVKSDVELVDGVYVATTQYENSSEDVKITLAKDGKTYTFDDADESLVLNFTPAE